MLLLAQILSAYMGVYVQDTYAEHGAEWRENLFYSHFLSLPLFLPLAGRLRRHYSSLARTAPLDLRHFEPADEAPTNILTTTLLSLTRALPFINTIPRGILLLLLNASTQLACIAGVNVLSARASAVTVTIVLNVRKLVSFVLSAWLFGHRFGGTMVLGAAMVFGSGALYGWESSVRLPGVRRREAEARAREVTGKGMVNGKVG